MPGCFKSLLAVVIQARLGSTRFPRKVCAELGGTTMIQQVYRRACQILPGLPVVVAVPWGEGREIWPDGPLLEGPSEPLARFAFAAKNSPSVLWIVRLTGDCPLLDPGICQTVILGLEGFEFARTCPDLDGLDTEVFSSVDLLQADQEASDAYDREHVTPWLRRRSHGVYEYRMPHRLQWSVNTPEDLDFVREVYAACPYCAQAVPRHTNARTSIGGSDRALAIDLHQLSHGGLVECLAAEILQTRMSEPDAD